MTEETSGAGIRLWIVRADGHSEICNVELTIHHEDFSVCVDDHHCHSTDGEDGEYYSYDGESHEEFSSGS